MRVREDETETCLHPSTLGSYAYHQLCRHFAQHSCNLANCTIMQQIPTVVRLYGCTGRLIFLSRSSSLSPLSLPVCFPLIQWAGFWRLCDVFVDRKLILLSVQQPQHHRRSVFHSHNTTAVQRSTATTPPPFDRHTN